MPDTSPSADAACPHPMDPRRGDNLSPKFAAFLCWLLQLAPMTQPAITGISVSGSCVLAATTDDPFFDTYLGSIGDLQRTREAACGGRAKGRDFPRIRAGPASRALAGRRHNNNPLRGSLDASCLRGGGALCSLRIALHGARLPTGAAALAAFGLSPARPCARRLRLLRWRSLPLSYRAVPDAARLPTSRFPPRRVERSTYEARREENGVSSACVAKNRLVQMHKGRGLGPLAHL